MGPPVHGGRRHDRPGHHRGSTYQDNEHKLRLGPPESPNPSGGKQPWITSRRWIFDADPPLARDCRWTADPCAILVARSTATGCRGRRLVPPPCAACGGHGPPARRGPAVRTGHHSPNHCAPLGHLEHRPRLPTSTTRGKEAEGFGRPWNTFWARFGGSSDPEALQDIIQELAEIEDRRERFEFFFALSEDA
ncbi:MAG: hypothetical protein CM15mP18_0110 [Methanobacteriota archaeon]|nr:MAG: hypothetical protein CM15mP18_0110 [Euryarchaeota archaeon]